MNPTDIEKHLESAEKLDRIKDKAFQFIKENLGNITELDVKTLILEETRKEGLISDEDMPIVAVQENTGNMHYFVDEKSNKVIEKDCLIMLDLWARIKSGGYYADITWMAFTGNKIPKEVEKTFEEVKNARTKAIAFIRERLKHNDIPRGKEVDEIARKALGKKEELFIHGLGHSLGYYHCHGKHFSLSKIEEKPLEREVPFTIEPGIYYKDKYGIRSEIDCYITLKNKLVITTSMQKYIVRLF